MITYNKNDLTPVTKNFKRREFDCKCSTCIKTTINDEFVKQYLQRIRDHFERGVIINSAFRCVSHNKNVGGAKFSLHLGGHAFDIRITGVTPQKIAQYCEYIGIKGIGLYSWGVHIDDRTKKFFWKSDNQIKQSTFNGKCPYTLGNRLLKLNCIGSDVKALQWILNNIYGYSLVIDGIFGKKTENAVRKFQERFSLAIDGKCGKQTRGVLKNA